MPNIIMADVAGGGGLDQFFTPVNGVTIQNDATYGYDNGFLITGISINAIKKIEVKFKLLDASAAHFIWFKADNSDSQPFIDKVSGWGGITFRVSTNETVDGITHYVLENVSASSSSWVKIGAWRDSTYSKTATYYLIKMWDQNGDLIVDMEPCVNTVSGLASFMNRVTGIFTNPTPSFVAGEVVQS